MVGTLLLGAVLAGLFLSGPRPATVQLDGAARIVAGNLYVSGTTDLPERAFVSIEIWREDTPSSDGPVNEVFDAVKVAGGRFDFAADVRGWPPGPVNVAAVYYPEEGQPPEAQQRYGPEGERLTGPNVFYDTGDPRVIWRTSVVLAAPSGGG